MARGRAAGAVAAWLKGEVLRQAEGRRPTVLILVFYPGQNELVASQSDRTQRRPNQTATPPIETPLSHPPQSFSLQISAPISIAIPARSPDRSSRSPGSPPAIPPGGLRYGFGRLMLEEGGGGVSDGRTPMADGSVRPRKPGARGFGSPDARTRFPSSDSERAAGYTAGDWSSDLRRSPRGVLKRKGEVIAGFGVEVSGAKRTKLEPLPPAYYADAYAGRARLGGGPRFDAEDAVGGGYRDSRRERTGLMDEMWRPPVAMPEKRTEYEYEGDNEVIKVGRGGVLKYRPANRKTACDAEKPPAVIVEDARRRSLGDAPYNASSYERPPLHRDRESKDELIPRLLKESKVRDEAFAMPVHVDRAYAKESSPSGGEVAGESRSSKLELKEKENDRLAGKASCSSALEVSPGSAKKGMGAKKISRGSEKQKVREQIKGLLISSGWKIELRPRKNRDYEDSVYVSPLGTGYWSITKAYEAFQSQLKQTNVSGNPIADNRSRKSVMRERDGGNPGMPDAPSALSTDALSILKRNVVNKRSSKKDLKDKIKGPAGLMNTCSNKKCMADLNINLPCSDESPLDSSEDHCSSEGKRKKHIGWTLLPRNFNQGPGSKVDDYTPHSGKMTVLAWLIDLETLPENGKVKYMNKRRTRALLEGWITRDGIHCSCCSKILPILKFEIHAGSKLRQPYQNIFVESSGFSLLECLLTAWRKQEKCKGSGFCSVDFSGSDSNDDVCQICGNGGDLICCVSCPSVFHVSCLGIEASPPGDWHCSSCTCKFCEEVHTDAPRGTSGSMLSTCHLCQKKYHRGCVTDVDRPSAEHSSYYVSFCGSICRKIYDKLQKLLGVRNELDSGLSWSLVQRFDVDSVTYPPGLVQRAEHNAKVSVALQVMDECFLPIVDTRSGVNLINNIVFNRGSNLHRLNFSGFYTFILERDEEIIASALIRICGTNFAEMPFIGTRVMYRRQGMCRLLIKAIEYVLSSLDIEKLVIPVVPQLVTIWTRMFGFRPLDDLSCHEILSTGVVTFPGMDLLVKTLLKEKEIADVREISRGSGSGSSASNCQVATIIPSKRFRSDSVCNKKSKIRDKSSGNMKIDVDNVSPDGLPGSCTLKYGRKLMGSTRFPRSSECRNCKSSPVSSDHRKERCRTCVMKSAIISEDAGSDACNDEPDDACVASTGNEMAEYSDWCSNGKAIPVSNGKSCYLF